MRPGIAASALLLCLVPAAPHATAAALDRFQCNVPAGYYRIADMGDSETLDMHAGSSLQSDVIGMLRNGEIVLSDGTRGMGNDRTWQRVKVWQTEGWVRSQRLQRTLPLTLAKTDIPQAGWCGAYTPLWSMSWTAQKLSVSLYPGKHELALTSVQPGQSPGTTLLKGSSPELSMTLVYSDGVCRDEKGATQGWGTVYAVVRRDGVEQLYTGCCQAAVEAFVKR